MMQLSTNRGVNATINCGFDKLYNPLMEYKEFAKNLKELQIEKGFKNQIEFARHIGVSKSFISVLLLGEKLPSMDTALEICKKLNVNLDWLMLSKGEKRLGEGTNLRSVIDITDLSNEDAAFVSNLVAKLSKNTENKPQNNANKPLTTQPENVGGGAKTPDQPEPKQDWQAEDRRLNRIVDRRMKVNFSSADEYTDYPSVMARYKIK